MKNLFLMFSVFGFLIFNPIAFAGPNKKQCSDQCKEVKHSCYIRSLTDDQLDDAIEPCDRIIEKMIVEREKKPKNGPFKKFRNWRSEKRKDSLVKKFYQCGYNEKKNMLKKVNFEWYKTCELIGKHCKQKCNR